jgi:TorA maturation chaperone TorD
VNDAGSQPTATGPPDAEDRARANLYGLVSRLFYGPPDPNLLAEICRGGKAEGAGQHGVGFATAWHTLQEACLSAFPAVVRQEYDSLFIGAGRAEVTPYLSAYAEPASPDRHLVRLRDQLAAWGLERRQSVFEVEDHISGVSDVMRLLIEDGHSLMDQQFFFADFVYPGAQRFCTAIQGAASAGFYKHVAGFTQSFLELENAAFEVADTA